MVSSSTTRAPNPVASASREGRDSHGAGTLAKGPDFVIENTMRWPVGDRAVSELTFVRTSRTASDQIHGCDLFTMRDGKVLRKDTYLKQIRPASN